MSTIIRVVKSPDWVAFVTVWEGAGDAAEILVPAGTPRVFTHTVGTLRFSVGAGGGAGMDLPGDFVSRPDYQRDRFVDTTAPGVFPMSPGHWIAEARDGSAEGWCHVPLDVDKLTSVLGSRTVAESLLGGDWDGPYHVHWDTVQDGRIDPRDIGRVVQGRKIVDAELLEDSALNDFRVVLQEERARRRRELP